MIFLTAFKIVAKSIELLGLEGLFADIAESFGGWFLAVIDVVKLRVEIN